MLLYRVVFFESDVLDSNNEPADFMKGFYDDSTFEVYLNVSTDPDKKDLDSNVAFLAEKIDCPYCEIYDERDNLIKRMKLTKIVTLHTLELAEDV